MEIIYWVYRTILALFLGNKEDDTSKEEDEEKEENEEEKKEGRRGEEKEEGRQEDKEKVKDCWEDANEKVEQINLKKDEQIDMVTDIE